jgi:hypothetical protein
MTAAKLHFDEIIESIMLLPLGIAKKAVVLDFAHYFEKVAKQKKKIQKKNNFLIFCKKIYLNCCYFCSSWNFH